MRDFRVLDDLDEGIQIISPEMRYVYLNDVLLKNIQMTREEIVGHRMVDKFPGIDKTEIFREITLCFEEGEPRQFLNEFVFPDGRRTFHQLRLQPIAEGVIIFSRDVTASAEGEVLIRETNKQLESFTLFASHRMKEPVRRISLLSETLLSDFDDTSPEDARWMLSSLKEETEALLEVSDALRTISDLSSGDLVRRPQAIAALARGLGETQRRAAGRGELALRWPADDVTVEAYPELLRVLFEILYENAFEFAEGEVELLIDAEAPRGPVIRLRNDTKGLHRIREDIFLPFVKGELAPGLGLGLFIAKRIVQRHGGRIWLDQREGEFAVCFTLHPEA